MMAYFTLGTNMPGYLPESGPYIALTAYHAKGMMIDELLRDAEMADEAGDPEMAEVLSAEAEDLNLSDVSAGWGAIIGNTAYWIEPQEGEMPDDYWGSDYPNDDGGEHSQTEE